MAGVVIGNGHWDFRMESELSFFDQAINEFYSMQHLHLGTQLRVKTFEGMIAVST
jgi:hypothetical protein